MTEQERKLREQAFLDHSKGWEASLLKHAREDFEAGWVARSRVKNCLIADVVGSLPTDNLKDLLCDVAQLIHGWNATESEWSDWDEEVFKRVSDTLKLLKQ